MNVSAPYVYRYLANDELLFQYWNADSSTWVNWGPSFDALGNYTANANYCSGTPSNYVSPVLNIAGFTPTQLAGFKYRISYDDDPLAADYNWGFCFQSPTITSSTPPSCPTPTSLTAVFTHNSATLSWVENGSATLYNVEYGTNGFTQGTGTVLTGVSNSYNLSPLTPTLLIHIMYRQVVEAQQVTVLGQAHSTLLQGWLHHQMMIVQEQPL